MPDKRKFKAGESYYRSATFQRTAIDENARTVEVAFSSETEKVERWWGIEILDHGTESVRLGRLRNSGPLLVDHNTSDQVGVVESVSIGSDRVGRAVVRFGKSARADEIFQDVVDGIRTKISVGYRTHAVLETDEGTEHKPVVRVMDWEPHELSIVPIAADDDVGVGRAMQSNKSPLNEEREMPDPIIETPAAPAAQPAAAPAPAAQPAAAARAPDIDVNQVREEARTAENTRIREITSIGTRRGAADLATEFIDSGRSVDEFRAAVLDGMDDAGSDDGAPRRHVGVDLNTNENAGYSVVRALHAASTDDWSNAGLEREISQDIAQRMGRGTTGIFVPTGLRNTPEMHARALEVQTAAAGGNAVATDMQSLIDMLRNRMMVRRMGASVLSGLEGDMSFPRQATGSTFTWTAENPGSDLSDSDATVDQVTMAPKSGQTTTAYSRQLLAQSSIDIEMFVRNDITTAGATGLDLAALHGTGASNQPTGIINVSGIGDVPGGTNGLAPTWDNIVGLETAVAIDNADIGTLGYLTNAAVRGKMKTTPKESGQAIYLWNDGGEPGFGMVNGQRAGVSNQVASNLTKGTASGICSAMFYGNWASLMIGEWGAIEIILDPYSMKKQGLIEITSFVMADIAVRHAQSFAVTQDLRTDQ